MERKAEKDRSNPQQKRGVDDFENCLELIRQEKNDFRRRYVTMDDIRYHHYILLSNRYSDIGEPNPKVVKYATCSW